MSYGGITFFTSSRPITYHISSATPQPPEMSYERKPHDIMRYVMRLTIEFRPVNAYQTEGVFGTGILGTGMDVVPKLPKCLVPVLMSVRNLRKCPVPLLMLYRYYRSVRYRYERLYRYRRYRYSDRTEVAEVPATGIEVVSKLPKYPLPVLMSYRTHRRVRCAYLCRTEHTDVSG